MAVVHSPKISVIPLFMQSLAGEDPINYSAAEFRQLISANWPTAGIIGAASYHLTQAETVGWAVRIGGGVAVVGNYLVSLPEAVTISLAGKIQTAPIATQHHGVLLTVQDKTVTGDGYYAEIIVATDEGAGWSNQVPAAAGTLLLGVIGVSPGQSNIQNANISAKPPNASHGFAYVPLEGNALNSAYASAHTSADAGEARARYDSGTVRLTGGIKRANAASFTGDITLGTLPWYLKPNTHRRLAGIASGGLAWWLSIDTAGVIAAHLPTGSAATLFLDGMHYEVD